MYFTWHHHCFFLVKRKNLMKANISFGFAILLCLVTTPVFADSETEREIEIQSLSAQKYGSGMGLELGFERESGAFEIEAGSYKNGSGSKTVGRVSGELLPGGFLEFGGEIEQDLESRSASARFGTNINPSDTGKFRAGVELGALEHEEWQNRGKAYYGGYVEIEMGLSELIQFETSLRSRAHFKKDSDTFQGSVNEASIALAARLGEQTKVGARGIYEKQHAERTTVTGTESLDDNGKRVEIFVSTAF